MSNDLPSKSSLRLLICSAGRRVGLLECFRQAAANLELDLHVVACDLNPADSAACAVADQAVVVPRCDDPSYAQAVLDIVERHAIALVIPTIDPELLPLARAADAFAAAGASIHVSSAPVIEIVRDKQRTTAVLGGAGVPVPRTLGRADLAANPGGLDWPVFAKPSGGSASRGLMTFDRIEDIPTTFDEPMIFQDRLEGPEFTVNIFVDRGGVLRCVIPHRRIQVRAGEVEKGVTTRRADLREIAEGIVAALPGLRGAACFQVIDDGRRGPRVIEINARFGGGYPLADHAGARFAAWVIEDALGLPSTANDEWRDGVRMLRYDCAVFSG